MKKILSIILAVALALTATAFTVLAVDAEPTVNAELEELFNEYYNGGRYNRATYIYLQDEGDFNVDEDSVNAAFHGPAVFNRITYFRGLTLYMTTNSGYTSETRGADVQLNHFELDANNHITNVKSYGNLGDIDSFFVTMKDFADMAFDEWGVNAKGEYELANSDDLVDFMYFSASCLKNDNNYVTLTRAAVVETASGLEFKLYGTVENTDEFLVAKTIVTVPEVEEEAEPTTVTIVASELGLANDTAAIVDKYPISITSAQGTHSNSYPKYFTSGTNIRVYVGNTFTISVPAGCTIESVEFTATSSYELTNATFSSGKSSTSGTITTVTDVNAASLTFTNSNSGNTQMRFTKFTVVFSGKVCTHENQTTTTVAAKCDEAGSETVTCDDCHNTLSTKVLAATGHKDTNSDNKCDNCGEAMSSTPTVVLTIDKNDFNSTSYAANNTTKNEGGYTYTSYQVMLQSGAMQWKKNEGYITVTNAGFTKMDLTVTSGSFTVTVGGKTVTGTTSGGVTTYDLTGLTGDIKIKVGGTTGKTSQILFYQ